ncbi:MAG: MarR family transcriptional regulator [Anaerolineaceae bacterium]|nr:MarR family transcriptional regulator [Anaerolineaceae bacterium]
MSQRQNPHPNPPPQAREGDILDTPVIDRESNGTEHDHTSLRLWLRLLTCTTMIENCVKKGLRSDFETTLPRFDLMAQLERNPQGLTMGDLSQRMMVSGGNITGITDQLEKEGLVERLKLQGDRRVYHVRLTTKGKESFKSMARVHEEWIIDWMSDLTMDEQHLLYSMLGKLKKSLQEKGCES